MLHLNCRKTGNVKEKDMSKKVLLAGESWMSYTTHVKGFDSFYTSTYETGEKWLKEALEADGYEVTFMPNHLAMHEFPYTLEELQAYDCIILSDIGANTLLLPVATFTQSKRMPNRCNVIKAFVENGGGLIMVGGYLTFSGVDGKGKWQDTAVQDVLPVKIMATDDRSEHCEGITPVVCQDHSILSDIKGEWPHLLGYNKTVAKDEAGVLVKVGDDPLIALGSFGSGRSAVFTSDCAPHWAPPEFISWEHYNKMWQELVNWVIIK
jgi:uncharacterized membrane protein